MIRLPGAAKRTSGFTLLEIMIIVLIISIILLIALPSIIGARERSQSKTCIAQLRQIKYAKESWAMDNKKEPSDEAVWDDLQPTYLKNLPECPAGGTYTIGAVNSDPTCSLGGTHALE